MKKDKQMNESKEIKTELIQYAVRVDLPTRQHDFFNTKKGDGSFHSSHFGLALFLH